MPPCILQPSPQAPPCRSHASTPSWAPLLPSLPALLSSRCTLPAHKHRDPPTRVPRQGHYLPPGPEARPPFARKTHLGCLVPTMCASPSAAPAQGSPTFPFPVRGSAQLPARLPGWANRGRQVPGAPCPRAAETCGSACAFGGQQVSEHGQGAGRDRQGAGTDGQGEQAGTGREGRGGSRY